MKKQLKNIIAILMVLSLVFTCFSSIVCAQTVEAQDVEIELELGKSNATVNGKNVVVDENKAVTPFVLNDRTMVPFRFISENLDLTVSWDESEQLVVLVGKEVNIELTVGKMSAKVNGKSVPLDSAAVI